MTLAILTVLISAKKPVKVKKEVNELNLSVLMQQVMDFNQKKEPKKAIDLILNAIEQQKEGTFLRTLLIQSFDSFLEQELSSLEKTYTDNPKDVNSYKRAANALNVVGERFQALEVLTRGVCINPKAVELWMSMAKLELLAKREKDALDIYFEVIKLDKKNAEALNGVVLILAKRQAKLNKPIRLPIYNFSAIRFLPYE